MHVGRAGELVAAVLPAPRVRGAASAEERAGRSTQEPMIDQIQREKLMVDYAGAAGPRADAHGDGLRVRKALDAYGAVSLVEQRQNLVEVFGVSLYA